MRERKRVVVAGAAGLIAGQMLPALRERYDLTLLDVRTTDPDGNEVKGIHIADLLDRDRDRYRHHFTGAYFDQLIHKSIEAPDIRDAFGVPFQIFYGISGNTRAFWSIANARQVIGYAPQDDSEIRFRDLIAEHVEAALKTDPR